MINVIVRKSEVNVFIDEDVLQDLFVVIMETLENNHKSWSTYNKLEYRITEHLKEYKRKMNAEKRIFCSRSLDNPSPDGKHSWIDYIPNNCDRV